MKSNIERVREQVKELTPETVIEVIAAQMDRAQEAKERIEREGVVVRDMKGSVIAHPAIHVEIQAGKIIADLLLKNKKLK